MDKRKSPRYAINLNALVHPNVGRSWLCTIRDFCDGGMLLVEQEGNRRGALPGIAQGETVGIHFGVPIEAGRDQHFRLEGKIIRVMDSGVGINFPGGVEDDAMTALLNHSNSEPLKSRPQAREAGSGAGNREQRGGQSRDSLALTSEEGVNNGISPTDARRVIATIRKDVVRILPEMMSAFFSNMDETLLKLARDAKTNAEQSDYFAAMSTIEKAKKRIGQDFSREILDQIDNPRNLKTLREERKAAEEERKSNQASRVKLSLVNTDEFEDWLAVANMVTRSERSYEAQLSKLYRAMGMLVDSWGHAEANPIGTAVFCHAFDSSIRSLDINKDIRQRAYSGFESKVIPLLRKLYINVLKQIEESELFPDLDEDDFFAQPAIKSGTSTAEEEAAAEPEAEPEPEPEPEPEEAGEDSASSEDDEGDLRSQIKELREQLKDRNANRGQNRRRSDDQPVERAEASGQARAEPKKRADIGDTISTIYSTVRNLMGQRSESDFEDFEGEEGDIELVQLEEVQSLLSSLQGEIRGSSERVPVRQRIQESARAGGRARRLPPETLESLGIVENLVDSIESDNMLAPTAKDWIRQLELTLDKVATTHGDFMDTENPHRALEVINELARLGGTESGGIKRNVDQIVSKITENFDGNPKVFDEALSELKPLVERQSRAFSGNVQRTVKASEGQQTLVNAQRAVVAEMDQMFAGRQVPEVLMKLLMPGWRNLMVNTHLRQGKDSDEWNRQVEVLEQVMQRLEGNVDAADAMPPEQLLSSVEEGLEAIAFEPGQRAPLLNSLRRFIVDGEDASAIPKIAVGEDMIASTLGFAEVDQKEQRRQSLRESNEENESWQDWLERASRLHVGEWLEISDDRDSNQIAIVAWSNEDHSNYVFVNRRGVKTHELLLEELATRLSEGTARVLDEADIPLTDRASHRMLQNMHNQLTHQATHDELTGLVNRKEFERELGRVLGLAKRNQDTHLVAYMDLDQFKVVNNSAGSEGGDKLLQEIARLLTSRLEDVSAVVARLGGNEFGILIESCEREAGIAVTRQLCDQVKRHRFEWGGQSYQLTASCGVVIVDSDIESVSAIITAADAACTAAKDAGRDRVHIYETNDAEMANRRNIMEFVSQIDYAIENDRFILNCQKISPIDPDSGDHAHYEILLTVLDENDEPLPPQDFIVAAETYNRMGVIDRWVIRNAFRFIASNILKLDDLGAFSINISGNSLTEDDFMEFVLEQFNETRLPTSKICFEITETSAIGKLNDAIDFMERLKIIGVQFSLDDFGTGLSSYSYLRSLPVDYLKIDGIFVKDIKNNPNDYAVVKSINEIGHFMGKKTIAEFVEDDEILEILREIGVDFAQGYGIEKKKPITTLLG